jgi:hypothetical protein
MLIILLSSIVRSLHHTNQPDCYFDSQLIEASTLGIDKMYWSCTLPPALESSSALLDMLETPSIELKLPVL